MQLGLDSFDFVRIHFKMLNQYLTIDKGLAGEVSVTPSFDYLEECYFNEFLDGFPSVNRQQAEAVNEIAEKMFLEQAY